MSENEDGPKLWCPMSYNTPDQRDLLPCSDKCAWWDERNQQCRMVTIERSLSELAASVELLRHEQKPY
jgi:hypothetical protein